MRLRWRREAYICTVIFGKMQIPFKGLLTRSASPLTLAALLYMHYTLAALLDYRNLKFNAKCLRRAAVRASCKGIPNILMTFNHKICYSSPRVQ